MVFFLMVILVFLWCFVVQMFFLEVVWLLEVLNLILGELKFDKDNNFIFKGLLVCMGIYYGDCVSEIDLVIRRMDYFGLMVNKVLCIFVVVDGGQIVVLFDFILEIQWCFEIYQDIDCNGFQGFEDVFEDDLYVLVICKDLCFFIF